MVRHAELVRRVQADDLPGRLEVRIVVEDVRLIGIDVPLCHAGNLREHVRVGHRVVEIPPLPVKDKGVSVRPAKVGDQVGISGAFQSRDRILFGIGVQVAHEEDVGIADAGRIRRQPGREFIGRVKADAVAVALAIAGIRCVTGTALALQVVGHGHKLFAAGVVLPGLGQRRAVAVAAVTAGDEGHCVQRRGRADGRDAARFVDEGDFDRIGAERVQLAGGRVDIDEGIGPGCGRAVQLAHQLRKRAGGAVAVILDLVQADDVRAGTDDRFDGLWPLPVEFDLRVRAAAVGRSASYAERAVINRVGDTVKRVEVVEHIHVGHAQRAGGRWSGRRARVGRLEIRRDAAQRSDRPHAISVSTGRVARPSVGQNAYQIGDGITASQSIAGAQRIAVSSKEDRIGVLVVLSVVNDDPVQIVRVLLGDRRRAR